MSLHLQQEPSGPAPESLGLCVDSDPDLWFEVWALQINWALIVWWDLGDRELDSPLKGH